MKKIAPISVAALCALTLTACAKAPSEEIAASRDALRSARDAEAGLYADASLQSADAVMDRLEAELATQDGKFVLLRKYDTSRALAAEVKAAAEKAASDANAGKAEARAQTESLLAETRATLSGLHQMIAEAPVGKDSAADLKMIEADVTGIETSLSQVETALAEGRYIDALSRTRAAHGEALQITSEIESAMMARNEARTGSKKSS